MIDLKHEIERELSLIEPPDLWERIQADASSDRVAQTLELTTGRDRRRPSLWLAVAAVAACAAVIVAATQLISDREPVDVVDPSESPAPTLRGGDDPILLINVMRFIDGPLAGGRLDLDVEGPDDAVSGSLAFHGIHDGMVVTTDCADTDTESASYELLVIAGEVRSAPGDGAFAAGDRLSLVIRPGERDRLDGGPGREGFYRVQLAEDRAGRSCEDLVAAVSDEVLADEASWSSTGIPDTEPCSVDDRLVGTAELEIDGSSGEHVDAFGLRWVPVGSDVPPDGPAVAVLIDDERLQVSTAPGVGPVFLFEPAPCG